MASIRLIGWIFFSCMLFHTGFSQTNGTAIDLKNLKLSFTILAKNYQGKEQTSSLLEWQNNTLQALPANGWKMYFNFNHLLAVDPLNNEISIERINGGLFCLSPTATFKGLAPNKTVGFKLISSSTLVNITDAPTGFYLVWNNAPNKGYAIDGLGGKVLDNETQEESRIGNNRVAALVFDQNKNIADVDESKLVKIFPTPVSYEQQDGFFDITEHTPIFYAYECREAANDLVQLVFQLTGKKLHASLPTNTTYPSISFTKDSSAEGAYKLSVTSKNIHISGGTPAGMFYAVQSLKTLVDPSVYGKINTILKIQNVTVTDYPRFGYRGVMLDVARNFHDKASVLKLLDAMALYKLNVLHFHLTDDEGWRLQIPSLPELTEVGSRRGHDLKDAAFLPPAYGSGPDIDKTMGSGFYTKADFIEILKYALARHIKVIPEIETPGHARAAIKAMNVRYKRLMAKGNRAAATEYLLQDLHDSSVYMSVQKWNDNVMDVSLPSVYTFVEKVADEIIAMYNEAGAPLATIHFGGDEVPLGVWEKSPAYAALRKTHPEIKEVADLWYYYYGKVNAIVKSMNLYLSGWEEIALRKTVLDGKKRWIPNPLFADLNFHVNVWNNLIGNEDLAYRLANSGYNVILSFVSNLYFDMACYKSFNEPGFYWGGFIDIDKPFGFIPFDYLKNQTEDYLGRPHKKDFLVGKDRLTDYGKTNITGIQGLLWSETVKTEDRTEYMLFPRLLALAEKAWAQSPEWAETNDTSNAAALYATAYNRFLNVVGKRELKRLDHYSGGFNYRIPSPGVKIQNGQVIVNSQLPGLIIRYTTDGSEPTLKSEIYSTAITTKGEIDIQSFNEAGRGSAIVKVKNN